MDSPFRMKSLSGDAPATLLSSHDWRKGRLLEVAMRVLFKGITEGVRSTPETGMQLMDRTAPSA